MVNYINCQICGQKSPNPYQLYAGDKKINQELERMRRYHDFKVGDVVEYQDDMGVIVEKDELRNILPAWHRSPNSRPELNFNHMLLVKLLSQVGTQYTAALGATVLKRIIPYTPKAIEYGDRLVLATLASI